MPIIAFLASLVIIPVWLCYVFGVDISSEAKLEDYTRVQQYRSEFPELENAISQSLEDGKLTLWEVDALIEKRNKIVRQQNAEALDSLKSIMARN